ncbi:hypothetical protein GQ44DRAFT_360952 [Phaeosphaeriaceae sp. PMI808]|nr:hypothetical protein GQ44DRAFT_360952 [Phaeosphaeriaceae sp. PMI808]
MGKSILFFSILQFFQLVVAQTSIPTVQFPISHPSCPVLPLSQRTKCGTPTYKLCDTPTRGCGFCPLLNTSASNFGFFDNYTHEARLSTLDYIFFKSIELEYTIEFMKNPLPWEPKEELPLCGAPQVTQKRSVAKEKRGFPKILTYRGIVNAVKHTAGDIGDGLVDLGDGLVDLGGSVIDTADQLLHGMLPISTDTWDKLN